VSDNLANGRLFRVSRRAPNVKAEWIRLDDSDAEVERKREAMFRTVTEDIPVGDLWDAFHAACDFIRRHHDIDELPQSVRDIYFGKP
jgi:hypothetical protein